MVMTMEVISLRGVQLGEEKQSLLNKNEIAPTTLRSGVHRIRYAMLRDPSRVLRKRRPLASSR